eukprot:1750441-Rhodomonas_salina.4
MMRAASVRGPWPSMASARLSHGARCLPTFPSHISATRTCGHSKQRVRVSTVRRVTEASCDRSMRLCMGKRSAQSRRRDHAGRARPANATAPTRAAALAHAPPCRPSAQLSTLPRPAEALPTNPPPWPRSAPPTSPCPTAMMMRARLRAATASVDARNIATLRSPSLTSSTHLTSWQRHATQTLISTLRLASDQMGMSYLRQHPPQPRAPSHLPHR